MPSYRVTVDGTSFEVEIDDPLASPAVVVVDGRRYSVTFEAARSAPAAPVPEPTPIAGPAPVLAPPAPVAAPRPAAPQPTAAGAPVVAPMPGKILAVGVAVGDRVSAGDEVCTMEAMKMAMAVRASGDGIVREIRVAAGQAVRHGEVLLVLG
jgi:biotin carboxyl carrier protein